MINKTLALGDHKIGDVLVIISPAVRNKKDRENKSKRPRSKVEQSRKKAREFFIKMKDKKNKISSEVPGENERVVLRANEAFTDEFVNPSVERQHGDRWMLKGPTKYIPQVEGNSSP